MRYSPTQDLTSGEKDLLWKFRYYLTRDKRVGFSFFFFFLCWCCGRILISEFDTGSNQISQICLVG